MKLGILVASDRHLDQLSGITRAAVRAGHSVRIFITDEGVRLLAKPPLGALSALEGVSIGYCDLSAERHGGRPANVPQAVTSGGQFQNAVMSTESDKVIVL